MLGWVVEGEGEIMWGRSPLYFLSQGMKRDVFCRVSDQDLDPDPDPYSESGSRMAKLTHKWRKNQCFEVLDGLFCELQASSVTWTYFMGA
jgi:hypothetical protein